MVLKTVKVVSKDGIHMRPCGLIVDKAQEYDCDVTIIKEDGSEADAKSMMSLTMLAILKNEILTIKADGSGEDEAVAGIVELIERDFEKVLTE